MARIAGVDLPRNKHIRIGLTYIYGIGHPRAARILAAAKVDPDKKVSDLAEDEVNRIRQTIEAEGDVEGDLRKDTSMHIKRLIEIGSYRGFRHRRNLPVRGQRTHTNARTRKGPRKGTVAQKKKSTAKT
jgi:small subunit ribosomal protein S13